MYKTEAASYNGGGGQVVVAVRQARRLLLTRRLVTPDHATQSRFRLNFRPLSCRKFAKIWL